MILDSIQSRDSALSSNIFYSSQHHSISFLRFIGIHLVYTTRSWWYYHHHVVVETNWIPIWTMATGFKNSRWLRKQLFIKIDSLRLHQSYSWACRCCAFQPLLWDKGLNLPAAAKAGGSSEFAGKRKLPCWIFVFCLLKNPSYFLADFFGGWQHRRSLDSQNLPWNLMGVGEKTPWKAHWI